MIERIAETNILCSLSQFAYGTNILCLLDSGVDAELDDEYGESHVELKSRACCETKRALPPVTARRRLIQCGRR